MGGITAFPSEIYQIFNFSSYPPIFEATISFYFYKIDDWNGENLTISINDEIAFQNSYNGGNDTSICGNSLQQDQIILIKTNASVDIPIVNISISVSSSSVLWGLRDIKTSINRCAGSCLSCTGYLSNECSGCYPLASLALGSCSCNSGFYQVDVIDCIKLPCSSCQICDISCKSCNGSSQFNCTECYESYELINSTCVSSETVVTITDMNNASSFGNIGQWTIVSSLFGSTSTDGSASFYMCFEKYMMFGGNNIFNSMTQISKVFIFSKTHYSLNVRVKIFKFYTANPANSMIFKFDSNNQFEVAVSDFDYTSSWFCG